MSKYAARFKAVEAGNLRRHIISVHKNNMAVDLRARCESKSGGGGRQFKAPHD